MQKRSSSVSAVRLTQCNTTVSYLCQKLKLSWSLTRLTSEIQHLLHKNIKGTLLAAPGWRLQASRQETQGSKIPYVVPLSQKETMQATQPQKQNKASSKEMNWRWELRLSLLWRLQRQWPPITRWPDYTQRAARRGREPPSWGVRQDPSEGVGEEGHLRFQAAAHSSSNSSIKWVH